MCRWGRRLRRRALADYLKVDMLSVRYKSVNFQVEEARAAIEAAMAQLHRQVKTPQPETLTCFL